MNNDLISRSALKKALEVTQYNDIDDLTRTERLIDNASTVVNYYTKGFADGERSGRNFPLTDEEKAIIVNQWRPKGEWKDHRWCSNCGCGIPTDVYGGGINAEEAHFCVECGADMRVKDELNNELNELEEEKDNE